MVRSSAAVFLLCLGTVAGAEEPVTLRETFNPGDRYSIELRVELDGRLSVPVDKQKEPQQVAMSGTGTLRYDERVLAPDDPEAAKVVRQYHKVEIRRTMNGLKQSADIRPAVRRLVVHRAGQNKVPFSPDGPLEWGEIEVVRTDVFCPVLVPGLLPARPVKPGDTWLVTRSAVQDLTDMDTLSAGGFTVALDSLLTLNGKRMAKLKVSGSVTGVDENGPCKHSLDGTGYFDLAENRLAYLSVKGSHELLDAKGQAAGRIDGRFTLERKAATDALSDERLAKVELTPNNENTLLRYDNPELGVSFVYSRRWRVGAVQGTQVTLDGPNGSGVLLTILTPDKVPTQDAYAAEVKEFFAKQKAVVTNFAAGAPGRFGMDTDLDGKPLRSECAVLSKPDGGLTLSATLPRADAGVLGKDIDRLIGSVTITKPAK